MDYLMLAEGDDSSDPQSNYGRKYANAITPKPPSFTNAGPCDKAPHPTNKTKTETETTVATKTWSDIYYNTQTHPFHCTEPACSRLAGFATLVELQRHCGARHSDAALRLWHQPCCFFTDHRTKMQQRVDALHGYSNYEGSSHKRARSLQVEKELAAMDDDVERLSPEDGDGDGEEYEQPHWKRQRRSESNTSSPKVEPSDANLRNNEKGAQPRWVMIWFDTRSVLQDIRRTPYEEEREASGYCFDGERAYCEEV